MGKNNKKKATYQGCFSLWGTWEGLLLRHGFLQIDFDKHTISVFAIDSAFAINHFDVVATYSIALAECVDATKNCIEELVRGRNEHEHVVTAEHIIIVDCIAKRNCNVQAIQLANQFLQLMNELGVQLSSHVRQSLGKLI